MKIGDKHGEFELVEIMGNKIKLLCSCGNIIIKKKYDFKRNKQCKSCFMKYRHGAKIGDFTIIKKGEKFKIEHKCGWVSDISRSTIYSHKLRCRKCDFNYYHSDPKYKLTYGVWLQMKNRCSNPRNKAYKYYGGRGIKVCEKWKSFVCFIQDMGTKPDGMSIDRINNDGDYKPENCRWINQNEQNKNKKGFWYDTYDKYKNAKATTICSLAKELGRQRQTVKQYLKRHPELQKKFNFPKK